MSTKKNQATPPNEEQLIQENQPNQAVQESSKNDETLITDKKEDPAVQDPALTDLQERINALEAREKKTAEFSVKLLEKSGKLLAKQQELDAREKSLDERELALETAKPGKKTPGLEFEFEGQNFKFKDSAPKVINIDGRKLSQKQIIADEDILLQLVGGNSGLIIKI